MALYSAAAQQMLSNWLGAHAASKLKELLESKHLYQKVELDNKAFAGEAKRILELVHTTHRTAFADFANTLLEQRFILIHPEMSSLLRTQTVTDSTPVLNLPNVVLLCETCDRREAFSPIWYADVSNEIRTAVAAGVAKQVNLPSAFQMLLLLYRCQRCLGLPESFLVRRTLSTFQFHGRSPMERVEVPKYLPKKEASHLQ